jgi:hypothetical protein
MGELKIINNFEAMAELNTGFHFNALLMPSRNVMTIKAMKLEE